MIIYAIPCTRTCDSTTAVASHIRTRRRPHTGMNRGNRVHSPVQLRTTAIILSSCRTFIAKDSAGAVKRGIQRFPDSDPEEGGAGRISPCIVSLAFDRPVSCITRIVRANLCDACMLVEFCLQFIPVAFSLFPSRVIIIFDPYVNAQM